MHRNLVNFINPQDKQWTPALSVGLTCLWMGLPEPRCSRLCPTLFLCNKVQAAGTASIKNPRDMDDKDKIIPWMLSVSPEIDEEQQKNYKQQAVEILSQMQMSGMLGNDSVFELQLKDVVITCVRLDKLKGQA